MTREEAINVLKHNYPTSCFADLCEAVDIAIKALSAQSERKKGKWIENSPVTMRCDQCGYVIRDWFWHQFRYCPNCGARMER